VRKHGVLLQEVVVHKGETYTEFVELGTLSRLRAQLVNILSDSWPQKIRINLEYKAVVVSPDATTALY
jgi:hypothetical protein